MAYGTQGINDSAQEITDSPNQRGEFKWDIVSRKIKLQLKFSYISGLIFLKYMYHILSIFPNRTEPPLALFLEVASLIHLSGLN